MLTKPLAEAEFENLKNKIMGVSYVNISTVSHGSVKKSEGMRNPAKKNESDKTSANSNKEQE